MGHELSYTVTILDGEMPAEGGPSALFIDIIGRPLSPVSVAGMHRRDPAAAVAVHKLQSAVRGLAARRPLIAVGQRGRQTKLRVFCSMPGQSGDN